MSVVVIVGFWDFLFQDINIGGLKGFKMKLFLISLFIFKVNSRGIFRNKSDFFYSRFVLNGSDEFLSWIVIVFEKFFKVEKKISIIIDIQGVVDFIFLLLLFFLYKNVI